MYRKGRVARCTPREAELKEAGKIVSQGVDSYCRRGGLVPQGEDGDLYCRRWQGGLLRLLN